MRLSKQEVEEWVLPYFRRESVTPDTLKKRRDVAALLALPVAEFEVWYAAREQVSKDLLARLTTASDVPSLLNPTFECSMREPTINGLISGLERGLQYLKIIKYLRTQA
jgi:hypothetical protein